MKTEQAMRRGTSVVAASLVALMLAGCAGTMPLRDDADTTLNGGKTVFLLTATLTSAYKPSIQLGPNFVPVCKKGATGGSNCVPYRVDEKAKPVAGKGESGNRYFLRLELESGEYEIVGLDGNDFLMGTYFVPIHANVQSSGTGIFYLGHVAATMRERKEGEARAGPPPFVWGLGGLAMAAATGFGFYGGTFDVEITDQSEQDIANFKNRFAALRGVAIQQSILPTFDRAKAQRRWDADPINRLRETQ